MACLERPECLRLHDAALVVAGLAGENEIVPAQRPSERAGDHMIEGGEIGRAAQALLQASCRDPAIDAAAAVAGENILEELGALRCLHAVQFRSRSVVFDGVELQGSRVVALGDTGSKAMVDTRRRNRNPFDDDNRYGDLPRGAVGFRGEGREYPGGYGRDADEFTGGVIDDGHGGPPDDEGFAPRFSRYRSGLGAFGDRDPNDAETRADFPDRQRIPPGPHRGRGPKGYKRSDERIHEDVCERLTEDRFIDASNIEVEVKGGEVTLSGTVASRGLKRRAEDLVEMASGVSHVQNNLRVESIA